MTDEDKNHIVGDWDPLVPAGKYEAMFLRHETYYFSRTFKLALHFKITGACEEHGTILKKHYNVKSINGKPGKSGNFNVGKRSYLLADYMRLFPAAIVKRTDRIAMSNFKNKLFEIEVRTVKKDYRQGKLDDLFKYSTIESIKGVEV